MLPAGIFTVIMQFMFYVRVYEFGCACLALRGSPPEGQTFEGIGDPIRKAFSKQLATEVIQVLQALTFDERKPAPVDMENHGFFLGFYFHISIGAGFSVINY